MTILGAQGIRDAMVKSYHRHICKLRRHPPPAGTTLHQAALYGALATRYIAGFEPRLEVAVWMELAPFLNLEPDEGLAALAEYVVYKEMPTEADAATLSISIRKGLAFFDEEQREAFEMTAIGQGFAWTLLT